MTQFAWPIRVYYEDSDAGGVVYHSNYLNFMERARTEWLRSLGFEQTELREQMGVLFVVRSLQMNYRKPAKFNDALLINNRLLEIGRSLLKFEQVIKRGDETLTEAVVDVVCIDAEKFKPVSIPTIIRTSMQSLVDNTSSPDTSH